MICILFIIKLSDERENLRAKILIYITCKRLTFMNDNKIDTIKECN